MLIIKEINFNQNQYYQNYQGYYYNYLQNNYYQADMADMTSTNAIEITIQDTQNLQETTFQLINGQIKTMSSRRITALDLPLEWQTLQNVNGQVTDIQRKLEVMKSVMPSEVQEEL